MPLMEDGPLEPEDTDDFGAEQAMAWQKLGGLFLGDNAAGVKTLWGRAGMIAVRAGIAKVWGDMVSVVIRNEHREASRDKPGYTRLTCSWSGLRTPRDAVTMVNGTIEDTTLSLTERFETAERVRWVLRHTLLTDH